MYLDVARSGSIVLNFPHIEPWDIPPRASCVLDLAEESRTLEEIGKAMNLTRERVRQIQVKAFSRLKAGKASHIVEWLKSLE